MDFTEDEEHRLIRAAIRDICARFPDEYWADLDASHTFPVGLLRRDGQGRLDRHRDPGGIRRRRRGITEASIILEEVAASGACMNGASSIHLSIFGMHPVVKHGSDELKRAYLPRVATGDLHVAFGVTEPDAGLDTTAIRTSAVRDGERLRGHRAQGVDVEGAGVRAGAAADPDHPRRAVRQAHRRADPVPGQRSTTRPSASGRSRSSAATPSRPARSPTTACSSTRRTASATKARASVTCSTA